MDKPFDRKKGITIGIINKKNLMALIRYSLLIFPLYANSVKIG